MKRTWWHGDASPPVSGGGGPSGSGASGRRGRDRDGSEARMCGRFAVAPSSSEPGIGERENRWNADNNRLTRPLGGFCRPVTRSGSPSHDLLALVTSSLSSYTAVNFPSGEAASKTSASKPSPSDSDEVPLTRDAVLLMVRANPFPPGKEALVVELTCVSRTPPKPSSSAVEGVGGGGDGGYDEEDNDGRPFLATVSDGVHTVRALIGGHLTVFDSLLRGAADVDNGGREGGGGRGGCSGGDTYLASVRGYVSSGTDFSPLLGPPFLFLSDLDILEVFHRSDCRLRRRWGTGARNEPAVPPRPYRHDRNGGGRVRAGDAGTFLSDWVPFFSDEELAGGSRVPLEGAEAGAGAGMGMGMRGEEDARRAAASFFARHSAMVTLHKASAVTATTPSFPPAFSARSSSDTAASSASSGTAGREERDRGALPAPSSTAVNDGGASNYLSALGNFVSSQIDRQKASLTSNSGREGADRARLTVERYAAALGMAMEHAERDRSGGGGGGAGDGGGGRGAGGGRGVGGDLSPAVLIGWHAELCGGGLHPGAGRIRKKSVRAGHTVFAPPDRVESELEKLCRGLRSLESRLLHHGGSTSSHGSSGLGPVLFAAAALFGVVDVHPFADGNGRLARIAANWALRRSGLPFVVNLFATPPQRAEFVRAIQAVRRNIALLPRRSSPPSGAAAGGIFPESGASDASLLDALRLAGLFSPLVDVLSDRIARAASELDRAAAALSDRNAAAEEERAARRFRERAASGTCLICFDDKPNVATLCCGQAVHLNCIAEWLSSRSSCPQCRGELPSLPLRVARGEEDRLAGMPAPAPARMSVAAYELGNDDEETESTVDETEVDTAEDETASANSWISPPPEEEDSTTTDDTTTDTAVDEPEQEDGPSFVRPPSPPGETEEDTTVDTATDDHEPSLQESPPPDETETTTTDETTEESEENTPPPAPPRRDEHNWRCTHGNCRNIMSNDCSNNLCGRCCVIHGYYTCERHNT